MDQILLQFSVMALPLLLAITLHEAAHAVTASALGDDTARVLGRVSLNPLRHIDPIGTIALPLFLWFTSGGAFVFGWAKPVPVNFARLRNPSRDMILVAVAGPVSNILMAATAVALLHGVGFLPDAGQEWAQRNLENAMAINLILAVFNMLPIPPLDGGRVAVGLLPWPLNSRLARIEPMGMMVVMGLFLVLPMIGRSINAPFEPFSLIISPVVNLLGQGLFWLFW